MKNDYTLHLSNPGCVSLADSPSVIQFAIPAFSLVIPAFVFVIPAKAGIQSFFWIPAFAGMTRTGGITLDFLSDDLKYFEYMPVTCFVLVQSR